MSTDMRSVPDLKISPHEFVAILGLPCEILLLASEYLHKVVYNAFEV